MALHERSGWGCPGASDDDGWKKLWKTMGKYGKPWKNMEKTWNNMETYGKIWDMTGIINGINLGNLDVPWDFTMVFYMPIWPSKRGSVSR